MRRILSALVGMAGLAAAGLLFLMVVSEKILNAAVTFTVSGQIPGTHAQLGFTSSLITSITILVTGVAGVIFYRNIRRKELLDLAASLRKNESAEEPSEPFDGEDIIMIAKELEIDELLGRHHSLPVQLQLF